MKKTVILLSLLAAGLSSFSQDFHRCYTHEAMVAQEEKTPGYISRVNETFERAKLHESHDREEVYTIPVVVHIVYNTEEQNLHDSVVYRQIETLNQDFRRLNEDADDVREEFSSIVGDSFIQFELASVDPDGNPTTGITRTETDVESFFDLGGTLSPAEGVKLTAEGGIDAWDQDHYLNIWVCDMTFFGSPFLLGYATPPDGLDHWPAGSVDGLGDGVVIQYQAFADNNPSPLTVGGTEMEVKGRTTTHEVGHYLGLRHIWGDGDCAEQDGVDDTPNAAEQSSQDCDHERNSCVDDILELGDLPDMVENFMDYSAESCQNSFTMGQIDIMRGVLEVDRYDLVNDNPALSTDEEIATVRFDAYPNPSQGNITLSFSSVSDANELSVIIYTESGQMVEQYNQIDSNQQFEISNLAKGLYWVTVRNNKAVTTKKIVII